MTGIIAIIGIAVTALFLGWGVLNFGCQIIASIKNRIGITAAAMAGAAFAGGFGLFVGVIFCAVLVAAKVFPATVSPGIGAFTFGAFLAVLTLLPAIYKLSTGKNFTHKLLPGSGDPRVKGNDDDSDGGGLTDAQKLAIGASLLTTLRR